MAQRRCRSRTKALSRNILSNRRQPLPHGRGSESGSEPRPSGSGCQGYFFTAPKRATQDHLKKHEGEMTMTATTNESMPVTWLLHRWQGGERNALDEMTPLVYQELRRIAARHLRRER